MSFGGHCGQAKSRLQPGYVGADCSLTLLPQNALAPLQDFLLFGVLFEATMIDSALASQPISF